MRIPGLALVLSLLVAACGNQDVTPPDAVPPIGISPAHALDIKEIIELGFLPGAENPQSYAYDADDRGQAVGYYVNESACSSAFIWKSGKMATLPALGGADGCGVAFAINVNDQIVGQSTSDVTQGMVATIWERRVPRDLALGDQSLAFDINDGGDVVGLARFPAGPHGFLLVDGVVTDLGTFGGAFSAAVAMNESRHVVGVADDAQNYSKAFVWFNGVMTMLETPGGTNSFAYDINEQGQVVGGVQMPDGSNHAFIWNSGIPTDLGTLGGTYSEANGINDLGEVVGTSVLPGSFLPRAFLWSSGVMTDLGTLPGGSAPNARARAITAGGIVAGASSSATAGQVATLWKLRKSKN